MDVYTIIKNNKYFKRTCPYIPFIALFAIVFYVHLIFPVKFWDYLWFANILEGNYSLLAMFNYSINQYLTWTSRIFLEFFLLPLTLLPLIVWQVLDSIVLVSIPALMVKLFSGFDYSSLNTENTNSTWKLNIKDKFNINLISCIVFLFAIFSTFTLLWSTSLLVTTLNYIWPIFFALLHFYLIKKYFWNGSLNDKFNKESEKQRKKHLIKKVLIYFFTIFSLLFAISHEIMTAIVLGSYLIIILYCKYKKLEIPKIMYVMFFITILGLLFVLMSPGNHSRTEYYISVAFPGYTSLTITDKIFFGYARLLDNLITRCDINSLFFLFTLGTFTYISSKKNKIRNGLIGFAPALISTLFYVVNFIGLSFISDFVKGGIFIPIFFRYAFERADLTTTIVCIFLYIIYTLFILASVYLIYKNGRKRVFNLVLLLLTLGVGSVAVMGLSPAGFDPSYRWGISYHFAIAFASFTMILSMYCKDELKRLKGYIGIIPVSISLLLYNAIPYHYYLHLIKEFGKFIADGMFTYTQTQSEFLASLYSATPIFNSIISGTILYSILAVSILWLIFQIYKKIEKPLFSYITLFSLLFSAFLLFSVGLLPVVRRVPLDNWYIYCTILLIFTIFLSILNYFINKD